jgi:hypothetical protein
MFICVQNSFSGVRICTDTHIYYRTAKAFRLKAKVLNLANGKIKAFLPTSLLIVRE